MNRALRRQLAKKGGGGDLGAALLGLRELTGSLKEALPEARRDLSDAQEFLKAHRAGLAELRYQLDRQRAVFLRMLQDQWALPNDAHTVLALEAQYGAEYDTMTFMCWVAMLGVGEDT